MTIRKMMVAMMMIVMMLTMMTRMALTSLNPTSSACSACLNAFTISCGSDSWVADRPWGMEKGEGLEIELVEVGQLRAKAEQLAWLEEMTELLSEPGEVRSYHLHLQNYFPSPINSHDALFYNTHRPETPQVNVEAVRSLESAGLALQPHPSVERGLSRLAGLRFDKNKSK